MKYYFYPIIFTNLFLILFAYSPTKAQVIENTKSTISFPGAEGFGKYTTGGRGGKVYFVTKTIDDDSEGTLRHAVKQSGARYIIFKTGGTIYLQSELKIKNGELTIAGQTAPGNGITIAGYPVFISANNVIIRYLRFRMGDQNKVEGDALGARLSENLIIDHCSMSWSTDETVSIYYSKNTTMQWCIISESLKNSIHQKGNHGYGGIWGGKNATFHHNLLAHHDSRNPRLGEPAGDIFATTDLVDLRNNVIYNWGQNSTYGAEAMNVNIINSYYKPGPATSKKNRIISIDKNINPETAIFNKWGKFFIDGNIMEGSPETTSNNWEFGVYNQFRKQYGTITEKEKYEMKLDKPHDIQNNVTTHSAKQAYEKVLALAGASFIRDIVDENILKDVKSGTATFIGSKGSENGIIDSQEDVGGYPKLNPGISLKDSDNDGMPDEWEIKNNLNPEIANANEKDIDKNYDNIEVYFNEIVKNITEKQL